MAKLSAVWKRKLFHNSSFETRLHLWFNLLTEQSMSLDGSRANQLDSSSSSISGFGRIAGCHPHVSSCSLCSFSQEGSKRTVPGALDGLAKAAVSSLIQRWHWAQSPSKGLLFWPVPFSFPFWPVSKDLQKKKFLGFFHYLQHPILWQRLGIKNQRQRFKGKTDIHRGCFRKSGSFRITKVLMSSAIITVTAVF